MKNSIISFCKRPVAKVHNLNFDIMMFGKGKKKSPSMQGDQIYLLKTGQAQCDSWYKTPTAI